MNHRAHKEHREIDSKKLCDLCVLCGSSSFASVTRRKTHCIQRTVREKIEFATTWRTNGVGHGENASG